MLPEPIPEQEPKETVLSWALDAKKGQASASEAICRLVKKHSPKKLFDYIQARKGVDLNAKDSYGLPPIAYAIGVSSKPNIACLQILLKFGAGSNLIFLRQELGADRKTSPLIEAVRLGDMNTLILETLLWRADILVEQAPNAKTALDIAQEKGFVKCAEILRARGALVNIPLSPASKRRKIPYTA